MSDGRTTTKPRLMVYDTDPSIHVRPVGKSVAVPAWVLPYLSGEQLYAVLDGTAQIAWRQVLKLRRV